MNGTKKKKYINNNMRNIAYFIYFYMLVLVQTQAIEGVSHSEPIDIPPRRELSWGYNTYNGTSKDENSYEFYSFQDLSSSTQETVDIFFVGDLSNFLK